MGGLGTDSGVVVERYLAAVLDTDRDRVWEVVEQALADGLTPEQVVFDVVVPVIGKMVELLTSDQEVNLAQNYISARTAEEVTDAMVRRFATPPASRGVVVLGTACGDFHGLGRKIVAGFLRAHFFTVHDLGLNVAPRRFVDAAVAEQARVIGVSSMMMHTAIGPEGPRAVRAALRDQGLEDRIHLVVGGAPYRFDAQLHLEVGAEGSADSALEAVALVSRFYPESTS